MNGMIKICNVMMYLCVTLQSYFTSNGLNYFNSHTFRTPMMKNNNFNSLIEMTCIQINIE